MIDRKRTGKSPRLAHVTPGETSLLEMIALAEAGDTGIARQVVENLGHMVAFAGSTNKLPGAAAAYLSRALADIAAGKDAKKVFHLKSKGRPREWPRDAKELGVDIMSQFIEQGDSIDSAAAAASIAVNEYVDALAERLKQRPIKPSDQVSPWKVFLRKPPLDGNSLEPMKSWYLELLKSKKPE